jgi:hypothetical protein
MSDDEFQRELRHEKKRGRMDGKRCVVCGEADMRTLQVASGRVLCAECRLEAEGKESTERHHLFGRNNDKYTAEMAANDHAILSDMQEDWPSETLVNRGRRFLRKRAACRRATHDMLLLVADQMLSEAQQDEDLDGFLETRFGEEWQQEFERFCRKRRRDE